MASQPDAPSPQLNIRTYREEETVVVRFEGEIDLQSAQQFGLSLDDAAAQTSELVIDLSSLTFMDSSGLAVLVRASLSADLEGRRIRLRRPTVQVRQLLDVSGLSDSFTIER